MCGTPISHVIWFTKAIQRNVPTRGKDRSRAERFSVKKFASTTPLRKQGLEAGTKSDRIASSCINWRRQLLSEVVTEPILTDAGGTSLSHWCHFRPFCSHKNSGKSQREVYVEGYPKGSEQHCAFYVCELLIKTLNRVKCHKYL